MSMDRRFAEYTGRADAGGGECGSGAGAAAAPWRLFERQRIPPAANVGRHTADWLPEFAGYSWIAYGAERQLVIRIIGSPEKEEVGVNRLFQQVLETRLVPGEDSSVSVVNWGPASSGHVAAAAGSFVYVFTPRALSTSETPALPLEWKQKTLLSHLAPVAHLSWTGSGDGILTAAGSKVLMWRHTDGGWSVAWQAPVDWPQGECATTWFYGGLAATAGGKQESSTGKGKATIWWWEEESEPQTVELGHPKHVTAIQWRPVSREISHEQHRPVLMTCCEDGVVRLWLEIDSGKARVEKNAGKDRCIKPAFFVSAVIEVNTSLQAGLGVDCFVTWAAERLHDYTAWPGDEVAACEWIVAVGPRQTIVLWSLHCLDDVSPPRCPRVLLWQQGTLRVVESEPEVSFATVPVCFKGVVQRNHPSVPPTSVDLVEVFPGGCIRRSRVWPPVSSVGGGRSSLDSGSVSKAGTWGRSSEDLFTCGHAGGQVNAALHPDVTRRVAASVDRTGVILLWSTNSPLEPYIEAPSLHVAAWRLCGRIPVQIEGESLRALCWSPVVLQGGKTILFSSHSRTIYCYLVSSISGNKYWAHHDFLYELQHPGKFSFEEVHAIEKFEENQPVIVLFASGNNRSVVVAWKLVIRIRTNGNDQDSGSFCYRGPLVEAEDMICVSSSEIEDVRFNPGERLLTFTGAASPYDFISSCDNGCIRLWKEQSSGICECVGQFTGHPERLTLAASDGYGRQLATSTYSGTAAFVNIWEVFCSSSGFLYSHNGQIVLPEAPGALSWFEGGDGLSLLATAVGEYVHVYVESRSEASDCTKWTCLASVNLQSSVHGIAWGIQGSLVLTSGSRVLILSHWAQASLKPDTQSGTAMLLEAAQLATSPRSSCHPKFIFQLLVNGEQHQARICLRRLLSCANNKSGDMLDFPNVQYKDLQRPPLADSTPKTWEFGKPVDDSEQAEFDGPLSGSELQQLTSAAHRFKDNSLLLVIIELLRDLDGMTQFSYLDEPGQRFTLLVRFTRLQNLDVIDSKAWAWALLSECKAALIDMLIAPDDLSWSVLRAIGAGFWFTDMEQLRPRIEKLARTQFLRQRDPKDCALFYIALDRKSALSGLCKLSRDERDRPLVEFFARDFQDEKNKAAALKNAYVLMGKHRHELAAAFFLLGGELDSAVSVCTQNLGDAQLALVLCRLVEGNSGQVARDLISKVLLPHAEAHDRWLAAVFQFLLGHRLEGLYKLAGKEDSCSLVDPDVGDFCRLVLSKPGMQADSSLSNRAFRISARSLGKHGLPLQALECLRKCVPDIPSSEATWLSPIVADDLFRLTIDDLVLKYLVPFVEDHPMWGKSEQINVDDIILQDLAIFKNKFSLNTASVVQSLASMSWHLGRPSFGFWLLDTATSNDAILEMLDSVSTAGSEVFCATILASGHATRTQCFQKQSVAYEDIRIDRTAEVPIELESTLSAGDTPTVFQINELRVYASQINQLIARNSSSPLSKVAGTETSLLALVFCIGAAWLEKQAELLLSMVRMLQDIQTLDFNTFVRAEPHANRKGSQSENGLQNDDDTWLLLSVALWSHVLAFIKRQIAGGVSEVSYSGFGRVSPKHSTVKSFAALSVVDTAVEGVKNPSSSAKDGRALLSSLTCILASLRKQLVLRMTDVGTDHALHRLVWNGLQVEDLKGPSENLTYSELWKLLCVNDEVRAALMLEGLDGSKKQSIKVGWTAASQFSSLPPGESSKQSRSFTVKGLIRTHFNTKFGKAEEALRLPGDSLEAVSVNSCSPEQVVVASANKGLVFIDLDTYTTFSESRDNLWADADWPQNGWAGSVSTPMPTYVSPGVGLGSKGGSGIGLGGAAVGMSALSKEFRKGAVGFGIPGYAGMAAWSMGWEEMTDFDSLDAPPTAQNVSTSATAAHPLRPFFLVGARNTHVYLWKFGETSPTATYGVLPAANVPPPYALASVSSVQFDRCGHRFATSAVDGTVCTWQLEVGGRSNVCPTESHLCFDRHAWDVAFIGESGAIVAATGSSRSGENLVIWNTLAPPSSARLSVACHEDGARCLALVQDDIGASPLIVTGGKRGDLSVHDFRYITSGKSRRRRNGYPQSSDKNSATDVVWHISKAHSGSITAIRSVPGTSLFLTASRDGDVKLWDVNKCEAINHWHRLHERRLFPLQVQAAVTDLRILPGGFISCGTDGVVKHLRLESESQD